MLTEAHAAQALENRKDNDKTNITLALNSKNKNHKDKNQGCLTTHDDELCNNM